MQTAPGLGTLGFQAPWLQARPAMLELLWSGEFGSLSLYSSFHSRKSGNSWDYGARNLEILG